MHPLFTVVTVYSNSVSEVKFPDGDPEIVSIPAVFPTIKPDGVFDAGIPSTIHDKLTPTAPPE